MPGLTLLGIDLKRESISELMRSLQSKIARWFNYTHNRRGRFWLDRFKSVLLEDEKAMFDCLLYVELNPVRAGIVERPEDYDGSSLYCREMKEDKWMASITDYKTEGLFSKRIRHFTDGIVIGSEEYIKQKLDKLRETKTYLARKNIVRQLNGLHTSLRSQREIAF